MPSFTTFSAAGVAAIQLAVVDTSGYPKGIAGTIATGASAPFLLTKMARKLGGKGVAPVRVIQAGDNSRNRHLYLFTPEDLPQLGFVFGVMDLTAHAAVTATKTATIGNSNAALLTPNTPAASAQLCVIANIDAQAADSGKFGQKKYENEFYPLVTVQPLYAEHDTITKADWEYSGNPTQVDKLPWGESLTVATYGATRAVGILLTSDYPMTMETFVGNGTTTQFNLTYTPAGTSPGGYISAWKNGTNTTAFTVTTSTKQITITTAPASNDVVVFLYEATDLLNT